MQTIPITWKPGDTTQVDFHMDANEVYAIQFTTPATMPNGNLQLKEFEFGGGIVGVESAWSTSPGDFSSHPTSNANDTAPAVDLRCSTETSHGKTKPADLLASTTYYWNLRTTATNAGGRRVSMRAPH